MRCARCRRPLLHPQEIAGMKLGDTCADLVRAAVLQPAREEQQHTEPDPRQVDLFQLPDLFGAATA